MSTRSAKFQRLRNLYQSHLWQGRMILVSLIIVIVLVVVRVSLPYTIVYSAVYWLGQQGIASQIEDIRMNVTDGTFTIINASGIKDGDTVFNIGKASIDWQWRPLSRKTIHITEVVLEDFDMQAAQFSDAVVIAGVVIKQNGQVQAPPAEEAQPVAWSTALDRIDFNDLVFCFQQFDSAYDEAQKNKLIDYCGNIDRVSWQGTFGLGDTGAPAQQPAAMLSADGTFQIQQLSLHNNLLDGALINIGDLLLSKIRVNGIDDIHLDAIDIDQLALLQDSGHSKHKHAVTVSKLIISGITLDHTSTLEIEAISLARPEVSIAKDSAGTWKFEQWLVQQASSESEPESKPESETQANRNNTFTISLGAITIRDAEACYQQPARTGKDKSEAIDYCMTLADTRWTGSTGIITPSGKQAIKLDISGDLSLDKFSARNNILNRDLLAFTNLAISKLRLKGVDDVAFNKLDFDNVTGLELTGAENSHTIDLGTLDVSAFRYRKKTLTIDTVAINDLGMELTQDKDGTLTIQQWKIEAADETRAAEAEPAQRAATTTAEAEPVKLKLGEFSLDTTRIVQLTDMSVTPNMQVGFKEIHINIKDLDSDKPQQQSPIELVAKTLRHGTIEIKGVAMPFDTKPSFDATGKIKGIDLRVASPKAEQAIGHIIKSGQMDADVKLLSEQGKLDSNIALVLHHFKLKAKSKEDAAALDETFGMPINQSLMLLKDKKDRIKLDIPITGDINDPSFNPTDAIIKATTKATTVTLITFYTPYGLAFAGGSVLFDLATAMNFDPLLFEPGSAQLNDAHKEQLAKLAKLLVERPQIHLTLCGFTNLNDRDKLFSEIIDPKKKIEPVSAERLTKLKQLGSERQDAVKNHLIEIGKIEHDRLILCEPEHSDDAESVAGVEISI
ncbi:MAG: DUF748 domain-containing protein [Gammaproteobacteria bacterium]